jgi:hypothetical protein
MWNLKCTIIPVIIGATRTVTRSLRKNLKAVPGKHSIDSLQKRAVLGTSHIIRKILQCEAWSLSVGDHCWFKRITRKNRPVTRHNNNNNNNNNNKSMPLIVRNIKVGSLVLFTTACCIHYLALCDNICIYIYIYIYMQKLIILIHSLIRYIFLITSSHFSLHFFVLCWLLFFLYS